MPRTLRRLIATALVVVPAVACGSGGPSAERTDPDPPAAAARIVTVDGPGAVVGDPESVVVAAMILTTGGDMDAALADGVVTAADVDAARAGLADGTLDALFD